LRSCLGCLQEKKRKRRKSEATCIAYCSRSTLSFRPILLSHVKPTSNVYAYNLVKFVFSFTKEWNASTVFCHSCSCNAFKSLIQFILKTNKKSKLILNTFILATLNTLPHPKEMVKLYANLHSFIILYGWWDTNISSHKSEAKGNKEILLQYNPT